MKKRWNGVSPAWRIVYSDGSCSPGFGSREWAHGVARLLNDAIGVLKVTPR